MSLLGLERDGSGPLFVWLHGFTQSKNSAHQFRSILTGSYEVLTIDLPGHGENAATTASLEESADLLAETLPNEPFILGATHSAVASRCTSRCVTRAITPPRGVERDAGNRRRRGA